MRRVVILLPLLLVLSGCGERFGWYVVSPATEQGQINLQFMIGGLWLTMALTLTAFALSMTLGLAVAIPSLSAKRGWRAVNRVYVEVIRSIPLLVLLFYVYLGLPTVFGRSVSLDVFWAGVLALAISDSAFQAEIFRSGIQSIDRGQWEAARSSGLTYAQTMRLVILPQAIRRILPPLGNQFVYVLKMSSLVSVIGAQELTRRANDLNTNEYRAFEIFTVLVLEYLALVLIVSAGVRWMERRLAQNDHR